MDPYDQFQEILDAHPSGAPKSDILKQILQILFTPEEAGIALHMSFRVKPAEEIAQSVSKPVDEVKAYLKSMADKVVIFCREKDGISYYGLLPTIPGLFEFPLMKGGGTTQTDTLSKLWEAYHQEKQGIAFCGNPTPAARVIPVDKSLIALSHVHPYEEIKSVVNISKYIAVSHCACRVSINKCNHPREVCFIFGSTAEFLVSKGYARQISNEEAIKILDQCEEHGLVHTSNNSIDKATFICNCCPCCCTILRGRTQLKHPHAFAQSSYQAFINKEDCNGCLICIEERCPMEAIAITEEGVAKVLPNNCIGCGLCVSACPQLAISLREISPAPQHPKTFQEMGLKIAAEKGKIDRFMKIMKQ